MTRRHPADGGDERKASTSLLAKLTLKPFPILAAIGLCWALATPIFAVPDEPTQVVKAAAVVRGELVGGAVAGPFTAVDVPAGVIGNRYACFIYQQSVPASCQPSLVGGMRTVSATTYVGRYPPLYYALVGSPTLVVSGNLAIYLMRILSVLWAALFLAAALRSALVSRAARLLVPALAVTITPYVFYFAGSVNPSSLEMPAALCAWTSGLVLFGEPEHRTDRRLLMRFALSVGVLALVRGLGPLFDAFILASLVALYGLRPLLDIVGARRGKIAAAGVGAAIAVAVAWLASVGGLQNLGGRFLPASAPESALVAASAHRFVQDLHEMVGMFGWWNATALPDWTTGLWYAIALAVVAAGLALASLRDRLVILGVLTGAVAFSIGSVAIDAQHTGIIGQGRYWLPLVAGGFLVCGHVAGGRAGTRFTVFNAAIFSVASAVQIYAFCYALDRYRFGLGRSTAPQPWAPPAGAPLLTVAIAALVVALGVWYWRAARPAYTRRLRLPVPQLVMAAATAVLAVVVADVPSAVASVSTFTWSGHTATSGGSRGWSAAGNWLEGQAPSGSLAHDQLVFSGPARCNGSQSEPCAGTDDLALNEARMIDVQGGGFTLASSAGALTLGAGGLRIDPGPSAPATDVTMEIMLGSDQTWTFTGGTTTLAGGIYGIDALTAELDPGTRLALTGNLDVGDLYLADPVPAGRAAASLSIAGVDLNGSNTNPVTVADMTVSGYGQLGPITATDVALTVGKGFTKNSTWTGTLHSSGDVTFDSASQVTFDDLHDPGQSGLGYAQLRASGVITLGSATLQLDAACSAPMGAVFPIITSRAVSGTFSRPDGSTIANGGITEAVPVGGRCAPYFRITYQAAGVTATRVPGP